MSVANAEQERLLERYERIIEISQKLTSTLDHNSLLQQIISAASELINTEAASILLIDPITGELRFEYATNINPHEMEKIVVPIEGSIAGWIAKHGEPRVIQDTSSEPGHFGTVDDTIEFETRNLLGVPMRTHTKVIGVLEVVNKRDGEKYTETDVNTLTTLAGQAAIAIENARLFRQSDFIAEMVHELRTPLMALKASTSLLLRPNLPEERREEMVRTMQGETNRLMRLTTDFLDLAQMESGRARLEITPFDLGQLLEESAEVVQPQAVEKDVTIVIDDGNPTCSIYGDRGKVKQVLLNLLTNAIKYNRPGGDIYIRAEEIPPTNDEQLPMAQIAVQDTGYGISRENQEQLFQKFFRVKSPADTTSGTGLGLVITKTIVEAHGGSIWLESEKAVGTTFFVTLPLAR
jgi:signal transduction histidine kinase